MRGMASESVSDGLWEALLTGDAAARHAAPLYGVLLEAAEAATNAPGGSFVLARLAQSLDGRIATDSGDSFWISGEADVLHTHRLRALFDAVVVGAGTIRADDPLLTTRSCRGPSPVRVVIDTERRLGAQYRVFRGGPATLLLCAEDAPGDGAGEAELVRLPRRDAGLDATVIIAALCARGLRRIYVEGGGITVSRFLAARCLDRLHVTIAPLLLGSGIPAFSFPGVTRPRDGMRLDWAVHRLGDDILFDIPLERR
jgi:diaminohydroxyphosphoribosylaminopyrimidine deaminase/5-amino-6-(5-phosphoribosylamino)uracil reductase